MSKNKQKKSGKKKVFYYILAAMGVLLLISGIYAYIIYTSTFKPNVFTEKNICIKVYNEDTFDDVVRKLEETNAIRDINSFIKVAKEKKYDENIVPGNYEIRNGWSNHKLIRNFINGRQTPVRLVLTNARTKQILSRKIDDYLLMTEDDLLSALNNDTILSDLGFKKETAIAMFIPNTYEFYWTIQPDEFLHKMKAEYDKFWNRDRLSKLERVGLDKIQVSILASIVEEETSKNDEKPVIAGLYLNRLRRGILLQADPTVKFAHQNFMIRRILRKHLEIDSPYNTYIYEGLPPGPICMPSIASIDAVLNYKEHSYIYMCAKEDFSGYHNFASSYEEHQQNAVKYRIELNKKKIK